MLDPVPPALAGAPTPPPPGDAGWSPAYSLVSGVLPLSDLGENKSVGFARCQLEVPQPGKVRLLLNSTKGLTLWLGDRPVELTGPDVTLDLPRGVQTLTFRIDKAQRGAEGLRVEIGDSPGAGHAQPVVGR